MTTEPEDGGWPTPRVSRRYGYGWPDARRTPLGASETLTRPATPPQLEREVRWAMWRQRWLRPLARCLGWLLDLLAGAP